MKTRGWLLAILFALLIVQGCTVEQRESAANTLTQIGDGAGAIAPVAGGYAPIVGLVSVVLNCIAAIVTPREAVRNARLKKAIRETATRIDELKTSEDSKVANAAEIVLKELDKLKDSAPDKIKKFLNLFDAVRKEAA